MSPEKDKELCRKFPLLYRDRNSNSRENLMRFGFSFEDGWFQIIYKLSEQLEPLIAAQAKTNIFFKIKVIFYTLISLLGFKVTVPKKHVACAVQVKEKFGGLRFYMHYKTPEMTKLIDQAERESYEVCEKCGQPGKTRTNRNWIRTLCDQCQLLK